MEQHDTSTARGGSISLREGGGGNGIRGEPPSSRWANGEHRSRRAPGANDLDTRPEAILGSAMYGLGNKRFKWGEHPPPRSTLKKKESHGNGNNNSNNDGEKAAEGRRGTADRRLPAGLDVGARPGAYAPSTARSTRTTATQAVPTTAKGKGKKDVAHNEFYSRFFERMQAIYKEHGEPSLTDAVRPVSQYNHHYKKAVMLADRANKLLDPLAADLASKRQGELEEIESSISRIREMRLRPKRRDVYPSKRTLPAPASTDAEKSELLKFTRRPEDEVVFKHEASKVKLMGRDLARLAPGSWLNDETINLFMRLLQERDTRIHERSDAADFSKCHFFNTFFLTKLYKGADGYDYNAVRRWTMPARLKATGQSRSSILDVDKIIVPVNQSNTHWTVAVVDLKNERLEYFDSLGGEDDECLAHLAQYVVDEFQNKRAEDRPDVLEWPRHFPKNIPRQHNGWDCGVYLSMFADYLSIEAEMGETNMDEYRLRMLRAFREMAVQDERGG